MGAWLNLIKEELDKVLDTFDDLNNKMKDGLKSVADKIEKGTIATKRATKVCEKLDTIRGLNEEKDSLRTCSSVDNSHYNTNYPAKNNERGKQPRETFEIFFSNNISIRHRVFVQGCVDDPSTTWHHRIPITLSWLPRIGWLRLYVRTRPPARLDSSSIRVRSLSSHDPLTKHRLSP